MSENDWSRNIRGVLRLSVLLITLAPGVVAQQTHGVWGVFLDGERAGALHSSAVDQAVRTALDSLHTRGYLSAVVDSALVSDMGGDLYLSRGPRATIVAIELDGVSSMDPALLLATLESRDGAYLDGEALVRDVGRILEALERSGRPAARAEVSQLELAPSEARIVIEVDEGEVYALRGIIVEPDGRIHPAFAAQLAGLRPGEPFERFEPQLVRSRLEASGLFAAVGEPELAFDEVGQLVIRVPAEEAQPGAVDLALGYLPPATAGDSGSLVGSGSIMLRNLFGRGRKLGLELVRNPGLVSSLDVRVSDPFVLGVPLGIEGSFSGYQQDSTFSRHRFGLQVGYRVAPGLEIFATGSREAVEAGVAGAALIDGRPLVPGAGSWFAGVGARFSHVDMPFNPRRGFVLETLLEQGTKRRSLPAGSDDPVSLRQQRLHASGRAFVPTFSRQALVVGADGRILLSEVFDDSDLFRFGGATSLRGYDEEQFRGNLVARALVEYRYLLDPTSFAFAFFDLGYVQRPETPGIEASERVLPGYGVGLQYRTPIGLVSASYALNPDEGPTRGRFHLGLSIGL